MLETPARFLAFIFYLPAVPSVGGLMPRSSSRLESALGDRLTAPTRHSQSLALGQLLLVCADEVWGRRARDVLRREGFDVEVDFDCTDVNAHLLSCRPDVVGIDLSLPESLGIALCASIRATTAVAIFAVGPSVSEATIVAALTAGADTVIPKDASPRELVARVRALLRRFPVVGSEKS